MNVLEILDLLELLKAGNSKNIVNFVDKLLHAEYEKGYADGFQARVDAGEHYDED